MRKDLEKETSPSQKSAPDDVAPERIPRERSNSVCEDEPPTKKLREPASSDGGDSPSIEVLVTPDLPLPFLRDEIKESDSSITGSSEAEDSQSGDRHSSKTRQVFSIV